MILSATDLSNFLSCRHRTALDLGEARGKRNRPQFYDPLLEALFARGLENERQYVEALERAGRRIVDLAEITDRTEAIASTVNAMRAGADAVVQGALEDGNWYSRPDVLLKPDSPSWPISRNVPTQFQRRDPPDFNFTEGTHPISGGPLGFLS